ncbi:MAG: glycosyltransferase family 9 protein [Candidatus Omnitrophica bacterium]|nr:glycosyltransferase family 9 protein [Candidatus Omnitrophota bacterium]
MTSEPRLKRILAVRSDRMGDLLMTLPALHAIRQRFPQAEITLLLQNGLEPLLEGHPDVDRVVSWRQSEGTGWLSSLRWAGRLRPFRFDLAVIFNPTRLFHVACFLAGIPQRIGYGRKFGFLLTKTIPDSKAVRKRHEVEYNLELCRLLGTDDSPPVLHLPEHPEAGRRAEHLFASRGIPLDKAPVAIHPWTSNPAKSWPVSDFQTLVGLLVRANQTVIIIGVPESPSLTKGWEEGAFNLSGQIPLGLLPPVLRRCRLLITNDSGPAHVAAGVGTPSIIVAPQEHAAVLERWRPWGTHKILLSPTPEMVFQTAEGMT